MKLSTAMLRPLGRLACTGFVLSSVLLNGQTVFAAEETAEKAEASAEVEAVEVPEAPADATPAELNAFAQKMLRRPEHITTRAELTTYFVDTVAPAVKIATDRVIGNADADIKDVVRAVGIRDMSLMYLSQLKPGGAAEIVAKFHEELKADKRPEVVTLAQRLVKTNFLRNWRRQEDEAKATFVAEVIEEVKAGEITIATVNQVGSYLGAINRAGDTELAKEITDALFPIFLKSEDSAVVEKTEQVAMGQVLQGWRKLDQEEKDVFVAKWIAKMQAGPVSKTTAQSIQLVLRGLERTDAETATKIRDIALVEFQKSDDEGTLAIAERLAAKARYANLVGNEMPLEGTYLDGTELDMSVFKGKVVLVDFWATWCGPCIGEIPNMLHEYERYHDKGFEILGISLDSNKQACIDFCKAKNIPWKSIIGEGDEMGWNQAMARHYGIGGIPSTIIIGADGKVVTLSARGAGLSKVLQELLGDPIEVEAEEEAVEDEAEAETAEAAAK